MQVHLATFLVLLHEVKNMFTTLEKIGLVCISIVGFQTVKAIFQFVYHAFLGPYIRSGVNLKEMGKWALVTGATDGLGKAYAEQLAKKGINIILISRTLEKLNAVAADIENKYKVETKIIQADFTQENETYHHIEKQITGLEIGILINNVGMSYPHPEYFLKLVEKDNKAYANLVQCNVVSVINMCKIILPGMIERERGVIVNISSTAAQIPSPLLSVYSATKAFVDKFSEDLATEYEACGIVVQCVLPGFVATNMSKIRSATWMAPFPNKFVSSAIRTIGIEERTTGYYPHTILVATINLLNSISPRISRWITKRTMLNIRARSLRRQK